MAKLKYHNGQEWEQLSPNMEEYNTTKGMIGTLANLLTTAKNNLVVAINEIFGWVEDVETDLETHKADKATKDKLGHVKQGDRVNIDLDGKISVPADAFLSSPDDVVVAGTYTGNDAATRTINLGFTPRAVLVMPKNAVTSASGTSWKITGALATTGGDAVTENGKTALRVTTNGFVVYKSGTGTNDAYTNTSDANLNPFRYIAFK